MKKILVTILNVILVLSLWGYNVQATEPDPEGEPAAPVATGSDATEAPAVQTIEKYDEKKGIASIRLMYSADSGAKDVIKVGYAFFVGKPESYYLISCCDTVILTDAEKEAVAASHGVTSDKVRTVIELVLKNDVIVELSVVNSSEGMDFAILQPSSQLSSVENIRLSTQSNVVRRGDVVHTYDADMQQIDCMIEDWSEINNAHYFKYTSDIPVTKGMPLLNEEGEVIAIASAANKGVPDEYYALQIDEVIEVLDVLGIEYNPAIEIDTTALEEARSRFEELEKKEYTTDTWKDCQDAYDKTRRVLDKVEEGEINSYTQDEVNAAADELNAKIDALEKIGWTVKKVVKLAIIIGAGLVLIILILIILLIVQSKKYKKKLKAEENNTVKAREALKMNGRITPGFLANNTNMPANRSLNEAGAAQMMDAGGETSVLGMDMGYQNTGYAENAAAYPTLLRYKTGETIMIRQNSFIIGSAMESVDYCVKYNSNISRKHACIMKFEDGYYIQDLDTTNGTYVNDVRVTPGRYVKLAPGSIIKLAEEDFEFKG